MVLSTSIDDAKSRGFRDRELIDRCQVPIGRDYKMDACAPATRSSSPQRSATPNCDEVNARVARAIQIRFQDDRRRTP